MDLLGPARGRSLSQKDFGPTSEPDFEPTGGLKWGALLPLNGP